MVTWTYMNIIGQGHSLTLVQGYLDSTFSNFFFLETAWPIETKFYVKHPWDGGTKVWSKGLGHMAKVATMSIYRKNLIISSSLEPKSRWPWKLVCSIKYSSATKFVQIMTLTYFTARSNLDPYALMWEKGKTRDLFSRKYNSSLWYKSW